MDDCLGYLIVIGIIGSIIVFIVVALLYIGAFLAGIAALIGAIIGCYFAVYDYLEAVNEVFAKNRTRQKKIKEGKEPAFLSYFFGGSYRDLGEIIRTAWCNHGAVIKNCFAGIVDGYLDSDGFWGKAWATIKAIARIMVGVSLVTIGSLICVCMSLIHIVILFVLTLINYIITLIVWIGEKIYITGHGIFGACPVKKCHYTIPVYICDCGAEHRKLMPGKYGAFKRTCRCGKKLPTMILNGRRKLTAKCPVCGAMIKGNDPNAEMTSETVPVCIPVIGGPSVGKTCYITAVMQELVEKVAPKANVELSFYNQSNELSCKEMIEKYKQGVVQEKTSDQNPAAYNFLIKLDSKHERLVYFYDIAGEVFNETDNMNTQLQYAYSQGFILMVDPLSIPGIRSTVEQENILSDNGASVTDLNETFNRFIIKLSELSGLSQQKLMKVPCAVVVNKIDIPMLNKQIGKMAILRKLNSPENEKKTFDQVMDQEVREFLIRYGMTNFINSIDTTFKSVRYFATSSLGHTEELSNAGQRASFGGVYTMEPFEWIASEADPVMKKMFERYRGK